MQIEKKSELLIVILLNMILLILTRRYFLTSLLQALKISLTNLIMRISMFPILKGSLVYYVLVRSDRSFLPFLNHLLQYAFLLISNGKH